MPLTKAQKAAKRRYYRKNKAKIAAEHKAYYEAHKERIMQRVKEWKQANPEKRYAYSRAWDKKNPEKMRGYWRTYADKKRTREALEALAQAKPSRPTPRLSALVKLAEAKATQASYGIQRVAYT